MYFLQSTHSRIVITLVTTVVCFFVFPVFVLSQSGQPVFNEYEASLLAQLKEVQQQIEGTKAELKQAQGTSKSLSTDIKIYDSKIKKIGLEMKETELLLAESQLALNEINGELALADTKIEKGRAQLTSLIRTMNERRETTFGIIFYADSLSDFFSEVSALEAINKKIQSALQEIRLSKEEFSKIQDEMEQDKETYLMLKTKQEYQRIDLSKNKQKKSDLLKETQGKESLYKQKIADNEKAAAQIRDQMFFLQNMGGSLRFEEAVKLAEYVGGIVGIRPAFLLGILSKESNLGKNVGKGNWKVDMNPNQQDEFIAITKKLNLDPDKMPVSATPSYGWGGAMGPAQFLPATWLLYENQIAFHSGHNPPNPWNNTDAFFASALYLRDLGATAQNELAEWTAAMKYLAGSNWKKPSLRFYGDHVMEIAARIQEDIKIMEAK